MITMIITVINLLGYANPPPLHSFSSSKKKWITSPPTVFLKQIHGQLDFFKASKIKSKHMTSIFPGNLWIHWWMGGLGNTAWAPEGCERPRSRARRGPLTSSWFIISYWHCCPDDPWRAEWLPHHFLIQSHGGGSKLIMTPFLLRTLILTFSMILVLILIVTIVLVHPDLDIEFWPHDPNPNFNPHQTQS